MCPKTFARRRARAVVLALVVAVACVLAAWASPARAADGVTRDLGGVAYTVPADWQEETVPEDILAQGGLSDAVVFHLEDGLFFGAVVANAGLTQADLDEFAMSGDAMMSSLYSQVAVAGINVQPFQFSTGVEQGYPALTVYTDDIALNGVDYAVTVKVYLVGEAESDPAVILFTVLPVSGQVTADFANSFPVLAEAQRIEHMGVSWEIPAGSTLVDCSVFGLDFTVAKRGDAYAVLSGVPMGIPAGSILAEDLQLIADDLMAQFAADPTASALLSAFWAGGYLFCGAPTLGMELSASVDDLADLGVDVSAIEVSGDAYMALSVSFAPGGVAAVGFFEPSGDGFAQGMLQSAYAVEGQQGVAAPVSDDVAQGFVVGK